MKYLLIVALLISSVGYGQTKYYIRADSTMLQKVGGNNTLIIENSTKALTNSFLRNYSNGRTDFAYAVDSVWKMNDSTFVVRRGDGNDTLIVSGGGGSAGGANVKLSSPFLKGSGDSISLIPAFRSQLSYSDQSSYITNLAWTQRTADAGLSFRDGGLYFYINDTVFKVGGFDGILGTTDSIHYSSNKGITWSPYAIKWPYPVGNVARIKARRPGDWNYVIGDAGGGNEGTVIRFKNLQELFTMTTTAAFDPAYLGGADQDDNGNLYYVGGQTSGSDTTTAVKDVWYSTAQSGGATWVKVQENVSWLGGCLIDQVVYRDGFLYVFNAGNKMNSLGVSAYSAATYKIAVNEILDTLKWKRLEDAPAVVANQLFITTEVFKGMIWAGFGANSVPSNNNGTAYLDKSDKWHSYYNYTGVDSTTVLQPAHARDFLVLDNSMLVGTGNGADAVYLLADTNYSTPFYVRDVFGVGSKSRFSQTFGGAITSFGNGVVAATDAADQFKRISTDPNNMYMMQGTGIGQVWGNLSTSNSTLNTNTALTTGNLMSLSTAGVLTVSASGASGVEKLIVHRGATLLGHNASQAVGWGGTAIEGLLTNASGHALVQGNVGSNLKLGPNNTITVVITPTGMRVNGTADPTMALDVTGDVNATSYYIQGSQVIYQTGLNLNFGQGAGFTSQTVPGEVRFGGNTAAFPMLLRSATDLHVKLADGSAFTGLEALSLKLNAGRLQTSQGADVASTAGAMTLGTDGNSFEITGTNSITLLSNVGWVNGSEVTLIFTSTATLINGTATSGTDITILLAGAANFSASANDLITLVLCEVGGTQAWREKSRSVN